MRSPTAVADGVFVFTSRRDQTTSTVVCHGRDALLVDPSWDADELAGIADWLAAAGLIVTAGFATHAHHDHLRWHPRFGDATRWASPDTADRAHRHRTELVAELGELPAQLVNLVGRLSPTDELDFPEPVQLLIHDAHTIGHTALWLPRTRVLLAADMLSDQELPLAEETDLNAYAAGLELIRSAAEQAALVVPGHGHPGADGAARWRADQRYLSTITQSEDPRLRHPGMAQAHQRNLRWLS